ncbi:MAG: hypothetical protein IJZ22_03560 [Bacteroidaceae bacterium]|nr:hypothetical protein [Bacteroidaceae bacterium]
MIIPGTAADLGLSVKWASCNVGATAPEEYGGYGPLFGSTNYMMYAYYRCNGLPVRPVCE